jgi:hypothetical protein
VAQGERRYKPHADGDPIDAVCRSCWVHIPLLPERVEIIEGRALYHCQKCEQSFLIRWDDAVALGAMKPPERR